VLVALGAVLWLLFLARGVLFPFVIGLALAYLLLPLVRRVEAALPFRESNPRRSRLLSVALVYLLFILALVVAGAMLLPLLFRQISRFISTLPDMWGQAQRVFQAWTIEARAQLPPEVIAELEGAAANIVRNLAIAAEEAAVQTVVVVSQTFSLLLGLITIPVWLFYVLKDRADAAAFFYSLVPPNARTDVAAIASIVDRVLSNYVRAQLLLGLAVGSVTAVVLTLMGIPFALVLGVIAGITELIPVLGPILGSIPGIVVTLANAPDKTLWVVLAFIGIQQVENNLLVPRIQGEAVEIHPAFIMVLLVVASEVGGLVGMLVAVPLAAVCKEVFLYLYHRWEPSAVPPGAG